MVLEVGKRKKIADVEFGSVRVNGFGKCESPPFSEMQGFCSLDLTQDPKHVRYLLYHLSYFPDPDIYFYIAIYSGHTGHLMWCVCTESNAYSLQINLLSA